MADVIERENTQYAFNSEDIESACELIEQWSEGKSITSVNLVYGMYSEEKLFDITDELVSQHLVYEALSYVIAKLDTDKIYSATELDDLICAGIDSCERFEGLDRFQIASAMCLIYNILINGMEYLLEKEGIKKVTVSRWRYM